MLSALKNFINELAGEAEGPKPFEAADYQLAAAALLVHIASVDGDFDDNEKARIRQLVEARFGLEGDEAAELIESAKESEADAVDLYRFTSVLKRRLDEDGRRQIVGMLWDMAHADGAVHEFEENVVWRVAELLGVSTRDRVELRREARDAADPAPSGPWSRGKDSGR
ncbi:MAG: TerB family tellurite resistance protein [Methylocystis sp.]